MEIQCYLLNDFVIRELRDPKAQITVVAITLEQQLDRASDP
jgi:hypothetical protein